MQPPLPSATTEWHNNTYPSLSPTRPEVSAKGKNIVITGGGTGIGAETAISFAKAGASRIALLGRREQPLLDTKAAIEKSYPGVDVFARSTDVSKKSEVDAAFAQFAGKGKIDVLVSNAAVPGPVELVASVDSDTFLDAVKQNLGGAIHVAQALLHHAAEGTVAINVSSGAAHENFGPKIGPYSAAKMAVVRFWDSLSFENPNIRVHNLQPGIVDTEMNRSAGGVEAAGMEDHVSLPATFIVWLASSEASFLKGKFLWSNWDVEELKARAKEIEAGRELSIGLVGWPFQMKQLPVWDFTSGATS